VTYLTYLRIPPAAFSQVVQYRDDKREMRIASARRIPLDDQGQMLINFFNAPDEDAFPAFSFKDVVEGRVDPDVFYDRIVLVGLHHHAGLNDMYAVPIGLDGSLMAGVEIHANVIETLLQNKPLREQGPLSQAIMIVGLSVLSSLLYSFASRRGYWMLIALFGALAIWFGGVFIYFNVQQVMVNLFHALLALILPAPIIIIANAVIETQQRQRAEWLLGSMLAASNQRLSLAGILPGVADDLRRILETQDVEIWLCDASGRDTKRAYPIRGPMDAPRRELIGRAIAGKTQLYHAGQLAIPLTWQGETLGAFWVLRQRRLPSAARRLLDLFVWQTASIIANAVLYTQTEELSNLKTRLLRMASHDLKNPLAAIIMGCEMLAERDPNWVLLSERQLKYIEIIQNSAQRMNQLVNDILDLERVRAGEHTIAPYDLAMILREVAESHKASAQFRHHTFIEEIPATFPSLSGNVTQIRQALSNLVGNAIKYTPEGGQITIRLEQQPHVARISVADTGYGIPEEAQPHLFREFYRAQTPDTIEIEGTGLGLSLVKAVIETHRGRVWFESAEGIGSTFYVELPIPARGE
jgi:signal transduction histidine kinase